MNQPKSDFVERAFIEVTKEQDISNQLALQLSGRSLSLIVVMCSPQADLNEICSRLYQLPHIQNVIGTRTAGEIGKTGYVSEHVVVLGFVAEYFVCDNLVLDDIQNIDDAKLSRDVLKLRQNLIEKSPNWTHDFALSFIDGLSQKEDDFVASVSVALGSTQLVGGSSGDGLEFKSAPIHYNGQTYVNAAILSILRTSCRVKTFKEDHFHPSQERLVVTGALPSNRIVTEINAAPAAREYARVVGIDPHQLSPFIFASHPLLVRIGETHHVRAIQQVKDEQLLFFSAIDEGMVLTIAEASNISDHLENVLLDLSKDEEPEQIFVFDCILRRLEAEQVQEIRRMSELLAKYHVVGYSTYGEQYNMLHVNQTLTGLAIYPPQPLKNVSDHGDH